MIRRLDAAATRPRLTCNGRVCIRERSSRLRHIRPGRGCLRTLRLLQAKWRNTKILPKPQYHSDYNELDECCACAIVTEPQLQPRVRRVEGMHRSRTTPVGMHMSSIRTGQSGCRPNTRRARKAHPYRGGRRMRRAATIISALLLGTIVMAASMSELYDTCGPTCWQGLLLVQRGAP